MDIDLTKQQDRVKCLVPCGCRFLKASLKIANFAIGKAMLVDAIWNTASTRSCVSQQVADTLALDIRGGSVLGIGGRVKARLTFALASPDSEGLIFKINCTKSCTIQNDCLNLR